MTDCTHTLTRGRPADSGAWCEACGEKVHEVDTRPCGECRHHMRLPGGSICRLHLMAVAPLMLVCYQLAKGSCWTAPL